MKTIDYTLNTRYLSDFVSLDVNLKELIFGSRSLIINKPTGAGATTLFIRDVSKPYIFALPTNSLIYSILDDNTTANLFAFTTKDLEGNKNNRVVKLGAYLKDCNVSGKHPRILCTYDSLPDLDRLTHYLNLNLVVDEYHLLTTAIYRDTATHKVIDTCIKFIKLGKSVALLSATPTPIKALGDLADFIDYQLTFKYDPSICMAPTLGTIVTESPFKTVVKVIDDFRSIYRDFKPGVYGSSTYNSLSARGFILTPQDFTTYSRVHYDTSVKPYLEGLYAIVDAKALPNCKLNEPLQAGTSYIGVLYIPNETEDRELNPLTEVDLLIEVDTDGTVEVSLYKVHKKIDTPDFMLLLKHFQFTYASHWNPKSPAYFNVRELIFFLNSVEQIINTVCLAGLLPEEVKLVIASNSKNKKNLKNTIVAYLTDKVRKAKLTDLHPRILERLGVKTDTDELTLNKVVEFADSFKIESASSPNKTFTFVTRTAFEGVNFFSSSAKIYIVSELQAEHTLVDSDTDALQIVGRLRTAHNPFYGTAQHIVGRTKLVYSESEPGNFRQVELDSRELALETKRKRTLEFIDDFTANPNLKSLQSVVEQLQAKETNRSIRETYFLKLKGGIVVFDVVSYEAALYELNNKLKPNFLNQLYSGETAFYLDKEKDAVAKVRTQVIDEESELLSSINKKKRPTLKEVYTEYCEGLNSSDPSIIYRLKSETGSFIKDLYGVREYLTNDHLEALHWRKSTIEPHLNIIKILKYNTTIKETITAELLKYELDYFSITDFVKLYRGIVHTTLVELLPEQYKVETDSVQTNLPTINVKNFRLYLGLFIDLYEQEGLELGERGEVKIRPIKPVSVAFEGSYNWELLRRVRVSGIVD